MSPALSLMVATYLLVKLRVLAASDAERDIVGVTVGTLVCTPRWTGENRPFRRRVKPAIAGR